MKRLWVCALAVGGALVLAGCDIRGPSEPSPISPPPDFGTPDLMPLGPSLSDLPPVPEPAIPVVPQAIPEAIPIDP